MALSFLTLPRELRNSVYDHFMTREALSDRQSLRRVCRQIKYEIDVELKQHVYNTIVKAVDPEQDRYSFNIKVTGAVPIVTFGLPISTFMDEAIRMGTLMTQPTPHVSLPYRLLEASPEVVHTSHLRVLDNMGVNDTLLNRYAVYIQKVATEYWTDQAGKESEVKMLGIVDLGR
jgi:hypothetical protein